MKRTFQAEVTMIGGGKGIFDVKWDGDLVFSKHKLGRFPNPGEVVFILREKGLG